MAATVTTGMLSRARSMWEQGAKARDIAEAVGLAQGTFEKISMRRRDMFPRRNHGGDWWFGRLALVDGIPAAKAAARLGCSKATVTRWRRRLYGVPR